MKKKFLKRIQRIIKYCIFAPLNHELQVISCLDKKFK
jgi:hypothetical protein